MKKTLLGVFAVAMLSLGVAMPTWARDPDEFTEAEQAEQTTQAATRTAFCDSTASPEDKAAAGCNQKTLCDDDNIDKALKDAAGCPENTGDRNNTIFSVAITLIRVVMSLFGIIAVGVIIYGAITYVTSTGEVAKTTRAKNIILYGIVGLIVASLAFALVNFVSTSIGGAA